MEVDLSDLKTLNKIKTISITERIFYNETYIR